ncbi:MAG: ComF family protein [Salibacteraceae bacterium]
MSLIREYLQDFSHLAFPYNCFGCNKALEAKELAVCEECSARLPKTKYWLQDENSVEKLFWGKIPIVRACSFLYFTKGGMVQSFMHNLKYNGKIAVGEILGDYFGEALKGTAFEEVDVVIPVPLHKSRLKKRGYNQCDSIARTMANALGKQYRTDAMIRTHANASQTKKGRYERWLNVKSLFEVMDTKGIKGKHVLLVDDVITTGSTLESCAAAILELPGTKVSIATIACPSPV